MKRWTWMLAGLAVLGLAAAVAWYASQPHNAAAQLARARAAEARGAVELARLKASGKPEDAARAAHLLERTLADYARVGERYPSAPERGDADFRILQLRDENATGPQARVDLIRDFLKTHPGSPHAADLRWRAATIIQQDLRAPLEAIRELEAFAADFPQDERAAEALFRVGTIHEEIREFNRALSAYRRVAAEHPKSRFADEAQFRAGNLLAEKMEKRGEAAEEFRKLERRSPAGRFASAASGARRRLEGEAATDEGRGYGRDYYGGVREVMEMDRWAREFDTPLARRLRGQRVDVLHADVRTRIAPADHMVTTTARLTVRADAGLTDVLVLRLGAPLGVTACRVDGTSVAVARQDDYALIDVGNAPAAPGAEVGVELVLEGRDAGSWGPDIITTRSVLLIGDKWFPTGNFGDGFTADLAVTVPADHTARAPGVDVGPEPAGDGHQTWRFRQELPMFNYALATGPYTRRSVPFASVDGRTIEIAAGVLPGTPDSFIDGYLREMPEVLRFFESRLGPFPHPRQEMAEVDRFPGGYGAPGLVLMGTSTFETTGIPAAFIAHEIAHAWFGNLLGLDLSPDSIPWLSEGFAQYWDALYYEHAQGRDAFVRHMRTLAENYYRALTALDDRPIRTTIWGDPIYQTLAYDKGAFVLHALRGVMGDEAFFGAMRDFVRAGRERVVTVAMFREAVEKRHGRPMGWFFEQWLDKPGIPRYRVNSAERVTTGTAAGRHAVRVGIEQVDKVFRMPVELEVATESGGERFRVEVDDAFSTHVLETTAPATRVVIDPDYWVLKHPRANEWSAEARDEADTAP